MFIKNAAVVGPQVETIELVLWPWVRRHGRNAIIEGFQAISGLAGNGPIFSHWFCSLALACTYLVNLPFALRLE